MNFNDLSDPLDITSAETLRTEKNKLRILSHGLSWLLRHGAFGAKVVLPSTRDGDNERGIICMTVDGYVPVDQVLCVRSKKFRGSKFTVQDIRNVVKIDSKQRFKLDERPAEEFRPLSLQWNTSTDQTLSPMPINTRTVNATQPEPLLLCIRANQGHSFLPGVVDANRLLTPLTPEELSGYKMIVHGTNENAWCQGIQKEGLRVMKRHHIHFATSLPSISSPKPPTTTKPTIESATSNLDKKFNGNNEVVSGIRRSCQIYIFINAIQCSLAGIVFYKSDNGVLLSEGLNGTIPLRCFSHVVQATTGIIIIDQRTSITADQDAPFVSNHHQLP